MQQDPKPNIGEASTANTYGGQRIPADAAASADLAFSLPDLEWMGSHAFKARYAVQPGVDREFGTRWGPRHNQSISHHLVTLDSPTGLSYAYDLTWDEYAVLATDVSATVVEAVMSRAMADDRHMSAEEFAGLMAEHLGVSAPDAQTRTHGAAGIEL